MLADTLYNGKVEGAYSQQYVTCERFDFFNSVKREEGSEHLPSFFLLCKSK
jgi:hypothetical protein